MEVIVKHGHIRQYTQEYSTMLWNWRIQVYIGTKTYTLNYHSLLYTFQLPVAKTSASKYIFFYDLIWFLSQGMQTGRVLLTRDWYIKLTINIRTTEFLRSDFTTCNSLLSTRLYHIYVKVGCIAEIIPENQKAVEVNTLLDRIEVSPS